jgi:hypothetical protein
LEYGILGHLRVLALLLQTYAVFHKYHYTGLRPEFYGFHQLCTDISMGDFYALDGHKMPVLKL